MIVSYMNNSHLKTRIQRIRTSDSQYGETHMYQVYQGADERVPIGHMCKTYTKDREINVKSKVSGTTKKPNKKAKAYIHFQLVLANILKDDGFRCSV